MLWQVSRSSLWAILVAGAATGLFGQMLYIPNQSDGTISTYVYDQDGGNLTELLPRVPSGGTPTSVTIHPNKKFAYVSNGGGGGNLPNLAAFSINPATGALTPAGSSPLTPGSGPAAVIVDPSGNFAFVAHQGVVNGASTVTAFSLDSSTGVPTPVPGSPFATPAGANSVVVHPNGKFVYVSAATAGQVAVFSIGANGALTAVDGSPFAARTNITWMAMDPAGKFLFVPERQDNGILAYSINATTGALTPVAGSPFPGGNSSPTGVAVDPAGKFLYFPVSGGGAVFQSAIGPTGALTQRANVGGVAGASDAIMDPQGKFLYIPGGTQSSLVFAYAINGNTGALASLGQPYQTGVNPQRGATVLLDPPVLPPISADAAFNRYSHAPQGMPNAGIAQGSRLSIIGKNIGPAVQVDAVAPLKTELGGVSIQIHSGDVTINGLMRIARQDFVVCVVPSNTPLGDATVTVAYKGRTTAPLPITITKTSVGIATRSDRGYGPAVAFNVPPDNPLVLNESLVQIPNTLSVSAKPGQIMLLQGTGLGPVTVDETVGFLLELDIPADVMVGNKPATVITKVREGASGADDILFKLPDDVPQGCLVPIAVQAGGVTSNVASISISSSGGSCSDPTGFTASDIDLAQRNKGLSIGIIDFHHLDLGGNVDNEAAGRFVRYDFDSLSGSFAAASTDTGIRGSFAVPPLGSCTVSLGSATGDVRGDESPFQRLNIVQALNLSGPNGKAQLAAPDYYFQTDNDFFTPGDYTVDNGTGTATFGPFKGALTLPPPLKWTNRDALTSADRSQDLTVNWTGGAADREFVMIAGFSQNERVIAAFLCTEKASAGKFTVPAWVISSIPASVATDRQTLPPGFLGLATAPFTSVGRFTGSGLDFGLFTYEQGAFIAVTFR